MCAVLKSKIFRPLVKDGKADFIQGGNANGKGERETKLNAECKDRWRLIAKEQGGDWWTANY